MWNGWLVGQPAGWLLGCLSAARSRTDQHRSTLLLSFSSYVYYSLCVHVYAHDSCLENAWFARVCVSLKKKKKKKAEGWRRGVLHVLGEVSAKKKFFNARSQVTVEGEGRMGHEILVSALFFFFFRWLAFRFLWSRERNFNCAIVCLVMRIRAPFFSSRSTGNC